ncbi:MAG: endo alpha-1,4 polygalactosaminidase [Cellvibrionaceae bacterium]
MRLMIAAFIFSLLLMGCQENDSSPPIEEDVVSAPNPDNPITDTTETNPDNSNNDAEEPPVTEETEESSDIPDENNDGSTTENDGSENGEVSGETQENGETQEGGEAEGNSSTDNTMEDDSANDDATEPEEVTEESSEDWYKPSPLATWHWQLSGTVNTSYGVEIYDIDLYDSPISLIDELHTKGIKVICYFSGGSYEEWRDDADQFTEEDMGNNLDGWPGERWLDIRSENVKSIMKARLDLAAEKGCDGVEPDNMDGYTNNPGVDINAQDQLTYNKFIAMEAHARNLSVALKNDLDQVEELVDFFDFAVNEQCYEYDECDLLKPFTDNGKAILNTEYKNIWKNNSGERAKLCADANAAGISTLVLPLMLDDNFRHSCL